MTARVIARFRFASNVFIYVALRVCFIRNGGILKFIFGRGGCEREAITNEIYPAPISKVLH